MLKKVPMAAVVLALTACQMESEAPVSTNEKTTNSKDVIFNGSVSSFWQAATYDNVTKESYLTGDGASENSSWQFVDLNDGVRQQVLDVRFSQTTGYSDFGFHASNEGGVTVDDFTSFDLSDYSEGHLKFDLNIIDFGDSTLGLYVHLECTWPCHSRHLPIANTVNVSAGLGNFPLIVNANEWTQISIPMEHFLADNLVEGDPNLEITKVNKLVIGPVWKSSTEQQGFHFQVDNIRFEK